MRFKVDENLPDEVCNPLNRAGHDAISVGQQGLGGVADAQLYQLCQNERRVLVTLDVDFANVQPEADSARPAAGARRRGKYAGGSGA